MKSKISKISNGKRKFAKICQESLEKNNIRVFGKIAGGLNDNEKIKSREYFRFSYDFPISKLQEKSIND